MMRVLLTSTAVLVALAGPAAAAARLELSLASARAEFVLGETVSVLVRLTNSGDEAAEVLRHLKPEYGNVRYTLAQGDRPARAYAPWALKDPAEPFTTLAPGQVLVEEVDLFYDAQGWTITEPGAWRVEAVFGEAVQAEPLTLTITAPRNEAERSAATALLGSPEAGRFLLLRGGEHLRQGAAVLERITSEQPQTPQAVAADLALGISQLRPARDFVAGQVRPADPTAAAVRLERVQDRPLSFERTVESRLALASAYRQLGRPEQARALETQLPRDVEARFPGLDLERLRTTIIPQVQRQFQGP
jgi:hypothetical protein